ncbi:uncharacterized protein LOC124912492 [Impatiens glandulifera]|uniref:uncharacterized protein LOC124912492 n=1 Tax=Impatiens glandulifera TaxID=253017 RepID=UPI001FB0714D|nr:uncharacterized protein LOC124912492 [Impatiens glandulifera]
MTISDVVVGNLTVLYFITIAAIKVYGLAMGQSFSGFFVLVTSTLLLAFIFLVSLTWDISRKAIKAFVSSSSSSSDAGGDYSGDNNIACRGGICWHGVAVRSPASQVRFSLPQRVDYRAAHHL